MTSTLTTKPLNHMITEIKSKTIQVIHLLRQVNFSEAQAEVLADLIEQKNAESVQLAERKIEINEERIAKDLDLLATKGDLLIVKKELELQIEKVRAEIEKVRSDLTRWITGAMIVQTGILFTLIKLFA